jgi:hypothetical protein
MVAHCFALANGKSASALARAETFYGNYPEVAYAIKAAVAAGLLGGAEFAAPLGTETFAVDLIEGAKPRSVIEQGDFYRTVFRRPFTHDESGPNVTWRFEGAPKKISAIRFRPQERLEPYIASSIVAISQELAEASDAVQQIRKLMIKALAVGPDVAFLDPANDGSTGAPASLTSTGVVVSPTGTTATAVSTDLKSLLSAVALHGNLGSPLLACSALTAIKLAAMRDTAGSPAFPAVRVDGGVLVGVPLLVSPATISEGSPSVDHVVAIDAAAVATAADNAVSLSFSTEASLQLDTAPSSSASAQTSLWQNNLLAMRVERAVNWRALRANAAASLVVTF